MLLLSLVAAAAGQHFIEVPATSAVEHVIKKVEPEYPAIAKAAHLQGKVTLKLVISRDGTVADVKTIDGHPMLVPAAIKAVKQWQYRPFIVEGKPTDVSTVIEVPFSLGISETRYKQEQEAAEDYFKREDKCRELLTAKEYGDAESSCRMAEELVEKLPPERQNERRLAYELLGHALFSQKKFSDALSQYQKELAIAQVSLQPYEAELGYSYHDMALVLHVTGDLKQACSYYERAEKTLELARGHIGAEFLKNKYAGTLKSVLREYSLALRQSGDAAGADAAEQKANAIVVKADVKDQ